jgi:hypothetical protein
MGQVDESEARAQALDDAQALRDAVEAEMQPAADDAERIGQVERILAQQEVELDALVSQPVFVIKAQDALAFQTLRAYHDLCNEHGCVDQAKEVVKAMTEFQIWQHDFRRLTKLPDHEHVDVYS